MPQVFIIQVTKGRIKYSQNNGDCFWDYFGNIGWKTIYDCSINDDYVGKTYRIQRDGGPENDSQPMTVSSIHRLITDSSGFCGGERACRVRIFLPYELYYDCPTARDATIPDPFAR